jgi:putative transposase
MDLLTEFIRTTKEPKEQLRGLAMQMVENNYTYREIQTILNVSVGFISKCKKAYSKSGVKGLRLGYRGKRGYLTHQQKQEVLTWLKTRSWWTVDEVFDYIEQQYGVIFESKQSYYNLLHLAGLSWKKSQPTHPNKDETLVAQKNKKLWIYL